MVVDPSKPFLRVEFDEFQETTDTQHILSFDKFGRSDPTININMYVFRLYHTRSSGSEQLLLVCNVRALDWFWARAGYLIFNCDQETIRLDFHEVSSDTERVSGNVECKEVGYYILTQELLKKICDSKKVMAKIYGDKKSDILFGDVKWPSTFQIYCQQFYNNFYDQTQYMDSLSQKTFQGGGGCFIATAAMGDYNDHAVLVLSAFRDNILMGSIFGRRFVEFYYRVSPSIANWMRKRSYVCRVVKWLFVLPVTKIVESFLSRR